MKSIPSVSCRKLLVLTIPNCYYESTMKQRLGFTIVEIIIVITVIAILATIGTVSYSSMQVRARDNERVADIDTMAASLESYYERFGKYPDQATITGSTFIATELRVTESALTSPGAGSVSAPIFSYIWGASANTAQYGYIAYRDTGTANQCTLATQTCTRFILSYTPEQSGVRVNVTSKFGN